MASLRDPGDRRTDRRLGGWRPPCGHSPASFPFPAAAFPLISRTWPRPVPAFCLVRTSAPCWTGSGCPPPRSPPPRSQGPQVGAPWEGHSGPPLTGPRSLCPVSGVANTAGALAGEKWAGVPCLQVSNPEFPGAPPHACVLPPAPLLRPSGWGVAPLGGSPQCQSSGGGGGEPRPQSWPGESTEPSSTVIMLPMACNRPQPRDPQM